MNRQPSTLELAAKIGAQLWLTLFWLLIVFVVGVVVWALAGPTEAVTIFAGVLAVFVALPLYLAKRRR